MVNQETKNIVFRVMMYLEQAHEEINKLDKSSFSVMAQQQIEGAHAQIARVLIIKQEPKEYISL